MSDSLPTNDELFERVVERTFALHAVLGETVFGDLADFVRQQLASCARICDGCRS